MAEIEQTMRVIMDEEQLHRMLDPILKEVNDLRKRVADLEEFARLTADCTTETREILTVLSHDYAQRRDDGR